MATTANTSELENQINMLERQLDRERRGRKTAEEMLRTKSVELHQKNNKIQVLAKRLEHALLAGNEDVFEYDLKTDSFQMFKTILDADAKIICAASLSDFIDTIHNDDRTEFCIQWDQHTNGSCEALDVTIRVLLPNTNEHHWCKVRARRILDEDTHKVIKVVGTLKDCHLEHLNQLSCITISNTFVRSEQPSCIIDYSTGHIVPTESFLHLVGCTSIQESDAEQDPYDNNDLKQILPIDLIKRAQKQGESSFNIKLSLPKSTIECLAIIPPLMQEKAGLQGHRYVVVIFKLI